MTVNNVQKRIHEDINISSESADSESVWYACYGSNLSSARFQEYLDSCGGDVVKTESKAYETTGISGTDDSVRSLFSFGLIK